MKCLSLVAVWVGLWVPVAAAAGPDDLVFIHHSCGRNWLNAGLDAALLAKDYIDERNDIYYSTDVSADAGRPDSLGPNPGDSTNMNHWVKWFNDYLAGVQAHGCSDGQNRIILFKSCYPISNVSSDGTEPGNPFSSSQTITNYKAVYRHPSGAGNTYASGGTTYQALEEVFAAHPETLFIPVTAPPRSYSTTTDAEGHRARLFNDWLSSDWQAAYDAANPGLCNVAVFDWFDVLAYADDHAEHPNRLKAEYGGTYSDSHPNTTANVDSTVIFASGADNFIDAAWNRFRPAPGDATRDGKVNYMDLGILATNYGQTGMTWDDGDFTGDHAVSYLDLGILSTCYGTGGAGIPVVPEPAALSLLLAAGAIPLRRLRRR